MASLSTLAPSGKKQLEADEAAQPLVGASSSGTGDLLDDDDDDLLPPAYTDQPVQQTPGRDIINDLPPAFTEYQPEAKVGDKQRVKTHDTHLNTDGEALFQYLQTKNSIHPYYYAHIVGTHTVTSERWVTRDGRSQRETDTRTETDFDFHIDLTELILDKYTGFLGERAWNEKCYRGSIFQKKGQISVGSQSDPVREWCHKYCEDKSYFKEFKMRKIVRGHDEALLREYFTTAIRSTNYGGSLSIKFETTRDRLTIQPDNMLSRWRTTKWIRVTFYCTLLFLISWPVLYFSTKRYHCIDSVWRTTDILGENARYTNDEVGEMWFETIRWAAMNGRRSGIVSVNEREMVRQQGLGRMNRRRQVRMGGLSRGLNTGSFLGTALGLTDVARQLVDDNPVWGQDERA